MKAEHPHIYILLAMIFMFCSTIASAEMKTDNLASVTTGVEDQSGVAITIYNVNLGLVKDQRVIKIPKGAAEVRFMGVASQIIPTSVHAKSLINADSLHVIEQNYEYDLLNPQRLMDKYVGKDLKLYYRNPYTEREEIVTATLLANNGSPIFRIGNEITFGHPGRIIFPEVPENLISKPTLVWIVDNSLSSSQKIEASYLTNNINWRADYVLILSEKDDRADLSGWVTIDNKSGTTYTDAKLKLVAGDVNRVREEQDYRHSMIRSEAAVAKAAPQFKEEEFFEYHIYSLDRPSTIKDNQTKQISLVSADEIPVKKEFIFKGANYYFTSRYADPVTNQKVNVFVEFQNRKEQNLGMPLPKGIVRVYKLDAEKSLQFVGEDSIDHTPKDEKIRIRLGDAFDVVGIRKQIDWKKTATDTYEASFEIILRNHKKEDIIVKVVEPIPGDWTMLNSTHTYKKAEAFTVEFNMPIPAGKETNLNYRVRMRY